MLRVELTRAARSDLVDIAAYTIEQWGDAQAERYVGALHRRIKWLKRNAQRCGPVPGLAGYHRVQEGRHVIIFRLLGDSAEVVRVLHERMLPRLHIEP
jgi:toxin ParE1/3/4